MRHAFPDADGRPELTRARGRVLVLGVGSDLRGDDGVGPALIQTIRDRAAAAGILAREHPGDPLGLLAAWHGSAGVVIVDAMDCAGADPGAVRRLDARREALPLQVAGRASTHATSIAEAAELARALHRLPPRLLVYGVQGARFEIGAGLSSPVRAALPRLAEVVMGEAVRLVPSPAGDGGTGWWRVTTHANRRKPRMPDGGVWTYGGTVGEDDE